MKRITIFGTVHTPIFNPVVAAKQMVTADHAGHGRFGLNLVVGNKDEEFGMFGVSLLEHDERYTHGQEWLDIVRRLWTDPENFDFDGKYFQLRDVLSKPKPHGGTQPLLLNAGTSEIRAGFRRAQQRRVLHLRACLGVRRADRRRHARHRRRDGSREQHSYAAAVGRTMGVYTNVNVICRPTQKEAIEYYRYVLDDHADWEAVDNQLQQQGVERDLDSPAYRAQRRARSGSSPSSATPTPWPVCSKR